MSRAALALLLVACSTSGPKRVGSQPSWRHASAPAAAGPLTFAPASEPARSYNEPLAPPPHSPLGDAVIAAVHAAAAQANLPPPIADARLFRTCAELAAVVPEDGVLDYGVEAFALQRNGIIEPSPHMFTVWGTIDALDEVVDQLRPFFGESLADSVVRFGVGSAPRKPDGSGVVVFVIQASGVATSPIPRSVPPDGNFAIDAVVDARYHDPELFVTRDDGSVERIALTVGHAGAFKATVACAHHAGRQEIEILASNASGAAVLANFPAWCGADPPSTLTVGPPDDAGPIRRDDAERQLLALLNRDRQAAGLRALLWDDRVAAVARAYSEEMQRTKVVAHISPISGSAGDRVRAAGIKTAAVLENVARDYSVAGAHAALMNSPGHRANLMSQTATHVGVGVALGGEAQHELYLTQVFIRIPPKVDVAQAAELIRQRIERARDVAVDPRLASIAQQLADGLALGKTREQLWPVAVKQIDALGGTYAHVTNVVDAVGELDTVDGKALLGDALPDDIGIGLAQGTHPEIGEGAIWIVLFMAERRK